MIAGVGCTGTPPNLLIQVTAPAGGDGARSQQPTRGPGRFGPSARAEASSDGGEDGDQAEAGTFSCPASMDEIEHVYVSVVEVSVQGQTATGSGWWTVSTAPQTLDLIALRGSLETLGLTTLPDGSYGQTRLQLADSWVVVDGVTWPMTTPSAATSGLKIPTDFTLSAGVQTVLTLSFDPNESVRCNPGQGFMLDPVVDLIGVIYIDPEVPEPPTYGEYTFPPRPGDPTPGEPTPTEGMPHFTPVVVPVYPATPTAAPPGTEPDPTPADPTAAAPTVVAETSPEPTAAEPTVTERGDDSPSPNEAWEGFDCANASTESYVDISGWQMFQTNPTGLRYWGTPTHIPVGWYLVVAHGATRSQFEAYWGALPSQVIFHSDPYYPVLSGGQTLGLKDACGDVVDGPTWAVPAGASIQRVGGPAGAEASWEASPATYGTPGQGAWRPYGVHITEVTDAGPNAPDNVDFMEIYAGGYPAWP